MPKDVLGRPVVTAAQMDAMTPDQRRDVFMSRLVWDLDELPVELAAQIRATGESSITSASTNGSKRRS